MHRFHGLLILAIFSLAPGSSGEELASPGDRNSGVHIRYPETAFFHNTGGGNVLDITKPPFNAKGDGLTDDTAAFVRAYDFILTEQDKTGYSGTAMLNTHGLYPNKEGYPVDEPLKNPDASYIIHIPNGEYLVSDTIIYCMPDRTPTKRRDKFFRNGKWVEHATGWERCIWVRFVGESREKTIIRLKDSAPGFDREKAVISFGKSPFNNRKAINCVTNLTVDTGKGNPGACAIDFTGANTARLSHLTLRSGDGRGGAGILIKRPPVIGYHHDITIEGFDYGILSLVGHASAPVFDHLTLRGQRKAGICLGEREGTGGHGEAFLVCRNLLVENGTGPALKLSGKGSHLVALHSSFETSKVGSAAVEIEAGHTYLSDIRTRGYETVISGTKGAGEMTNGHIEEFATGLERLPPDVSFPEISEAPPATWPSPGEWTTPEEHGAKADGEHDDTAAIQAAFDSGKSAVFLTRANYLTTAPIRVPASVTWVNGLFRYNPGVKFIVGENSEKAVTFTRFYRGEVVHSSPRTLVTDFAQLEYSNSPEAKGGTYHCLGGSYPAGKRNPAGITFIGRSVNNEGKGLPLTIDGSRADFLGFKSERGAPLVLKNGAEVRMIGATFGVKTGTKTQPAVTVEDSALTLVANKSADRWPSGQTVVSETREGVTTSLKASELPFRNTIKEANRLIPLYRTQE